MIRKILKRLFIIQVKEQRMSLGHVYKWKRLNPYNPLAYITICIVFVIGIILYGVVGIFEQISSKNPFKYQ